jgi:hypothetical protein
MQKQQKWQVIGNDADSDGSSIQEHADNNNNDNTTLVQGGGFGGGPAQMPHCAPTYAAILALSIVSGLGGTVVVNTTVKGEGKGDGEEGNTNDNNYMPYSIAGKQAQKLLTNVRLKLYAFFLSLSVTTTTTTTTAVMNDTTTTTTAFRMQNMMEKLMFLLLPMYSGTLPPATID